MTATTVATAETAGSGSPELQVKVVTTEVEKDFAKLIRAAVFVGEQGCSLAEEFDGNDYSCTHIIAYVDGDPAATLRIRYFGKFVMLERMAVLEKYRKLGIARDVAAFGFRFCRMKGFEKVYGLAIQGLEHMWAKLAKAGGAEYLPMTDVPIDCSGSKCIPVYGGMDPIENAIAYPVDHKLLAEMESNIPSYLQAHHHVGAA